MSEYWTKKRELKNSILPTIAAIGTILGYSIEPVKMLDHYDDCNPFVRLSANDGSGKKFYVSYDDNKPTHLEISGIINFGDSVFGITLRRDESNPHIKVAIARGPAIIAKEIERRMMPEYSRLFDDVASRVKEATRQRDELRATVARLKSAFAGFEVRDNREERSFYVLDAKMNRVAEVEVWSSIKVEFSNLNEEQAKQIIAFAGNVIAQKDGE